MAERFDRWIANPQRLGVLQNYDEFLLQEELPCLVDGCGWTGHQLSNHMNFAHGVPAEEFKRAAGFNLKTGVVSAPYRDVLCAREHIHEATFGDRRPVNHANVTGYISREAKEHHAKARALANEVSGPSRVCLGCGIGFQQKRVFGITKYHSVQCRDAHYAALRAVNRTEPRGRDEAGRFVSDSKRT